ncbi:MAG TPA: hypothetical protein VGH19_19115 [Verrucomicrobiae bacterium]
MSDRTSILHKRFEIWTSFTPEISKALSENIVAQGFLLLFTSMILDGGVIFRIVSMAAFAYWIAIFPILWRRPKTTNKFELGLVKIGFVCFLPLSLFSMPLWGWLRELMK